MSKSPKPRDRLCGNCKHFVAGGLCDLVRGQINSKAICDLHEFGNPLPIDTPVEPEKNKLETNYKPGFMVETTSGEMVENAIQMEHELLSRGIPEEEVHRAVVEYFSEPEPPNAMPWPGPVTGLDLAAPINSVIVPDTGVPLTDFTGLPNDTQPYPTSNVSPYGIGSTSQPYPSFLTPDPNSIGAQSNVYQISNGAAPQSANWNGLASDVNSEPSMHGEYGFNVAKAIPEWRYPIEQSQMYPLKFPDISIQPSGINPLMEAKKEKKKSWRDTLLKWALLLGGAAGITKILDSQDPDKPLEVFARYTAKLDDKTCPECRNANGKIYNIVEIHSRPVLPSENLGYTTRHPHCRCTWDIQKKFKGNPDTLSKKEENEIHDIEDEIRSAAKDGTLHTVRKDGTLVDTPRNTSPIKEGCSCMIPSLTIPVDMQKRKRLQEAITNLRSEFSWLTEDYVSNAKKLAEESDGKLYLIRAAGETITDHRGEGEPYRRKLSADELNSMARTAIGKSMDINHQPELETDATVLDVDFDKNRREMQMLVIERDPQINNAIEDGIITAVSINGGMPRSESVEPCNHGCAGDHCELCLVPKGVVLGELDGIAMTWVITDPKGLYWNGNFVPSATPGIKTTKIEAL